MFRDLESCIDAVTLKRQPSLMVLYIKPSQVRRVRRTSTLSPSAKLHQGSDEGTLDQKWVWSGRSEHLRHQSWVLPLGESQTTPCTRTAPPAKCLRFGEFIEFMSNKSVKTAEIPQFPIGPSYTGMAPFQDRSRTALSKRQTDRSFLPHQIRSKGLCSNRWPWSPNLEGGTWLGACGPLGRNSSSHSESLCLSIYIYIYISTLVPWRGLIIQTDVVSWIWDLLFRLMFCDLINDAVSRTIIEAGDSF